MEEKLALKRHTWRIFKKQHRLINCTHQPRQLPERNEEGFLPKTQLIYFDLTLAKAQYLKIPDEVEYYTTYRMYLEYSCTLFDKKQREFFGRSYLTIQENVVKFKELKEGIYLESTQSEQLFFHLHDNDVDNTLLIVEVILN